MYKTNIHIHAPGPRLPQPLPPRAAPTAPLQSLQHPPQTQQQRQ